MSEGVLIHELEKNKRQRVRVCLKQFKGHELVDVRIFAGLNEATNLPFPTREGISLRLAQLPELIGPLQFALSEAKRLGRMSGETESDKAA